MRVDNIINRYDNYLPYINGWREMRRASVAILLVENNGCVEVLFEVRAKTLKNQPGDVCLPGGKIDNNESPKDAVLREIKEEIGIPREDIQILCELDTVIRIDGMIIHPFLGLIKTKDNFNINYEEVDHIFYVPIDYLITNEPIIFYNKIDLKRPDNFPYHLINQGKNYNFNSGYNSSIFYQYTDYVIWGITAEIIYDFITYLSLKQ